MKAIVTIILSLLFVSPVYAKTKKVRSQNTYAKSINVDQQMDQLGSNEEIIKKARALQPNNTMSIVQKRQVDRTNRFEIGASYGFIGNDDSYIESRNVGAMLEFHVTPRWSLGLRYNDYQNGLTSEGQKLYDIAKQNQQAGLGYQAPAIDYPLRSYMAMLSWYPIYGKVSWFESAVSQFDFYLTAGAGQMALYSGNTTTYTGGIGMGVWVNSFLTTRLEARYQNYQDRVASTDRNVDSFVLQFGIGFML